MSNFTFFIAYGSQLSPTSSLKATVPFPLIGLETLIKNQLDMNVWSLFLNSQFCSLVCKSVPLSVHSVLITVALSEL